MFTHDTLAEARYSALKWNCPLSEAHADELLELLKLQTATGIVDLGCGWAELLLRAATKLPADSPVFGVDTDAKAIARGRSAATARGIKAKLEVENAVNWQGEVDRAICIGSSHTLGGNKEMMRRLAEIVPCGRVLIGDTCWETTPSTAAKDMFDEVVTLMELIEAAREAGWLVMHLSTTSVRDWDDFESRHRAGIREWALANRGDPRASEVRSQQDEREQAYLNTYRGVLSFAYLILAR